MEEILETLEGLIFPLVALTGVTLSITLIFSIVSGGYSTEANGWMNAVLVVFSALFVGLLIFRRDLLGL